MRLLCIISSSFSSFGIYIYSIIGIIIILIIHYRSKVSYMRQLRANALLLGVFIMPLSQDVVVRLHTPYTRKEYSFHRDHLRRADIHHRPALQACGKSECLVLEGKSVGDGSVCLSMRESEQRLRE